MKNESLALAFTLSLSGCAGSAQNTAGGASSASPAALHSFTSDGNGFFTHSFWYDDGQEVVVVDAQFTPAIAGALVAEIRARTRSPITRVIVTHPNPDKFNGLSVFHRLGAESIASKATALAMPGVDGYKRYFWIQIAKAFSDETYPRFEPVKTTFTGRSVITMKSGRTLSLFELAQPGVSSTQTVVRIDATGDLIVGDLVHHRTHAWLEGGIVDGAPRPSLEGWKADLRQLATLGGGKVYGGRGEFVAVGEAVAAELSYLEQADAIVTDYVRQLGPRSSELRDAAKSKAHFMAIQDALAAAFPDYAQADLVGYGVYGLALQKLP
jgi:glyoxylase-like metal-dependent hydrolase (beta-lactamase superfamily II)